MRQDADRNEYDCYTAEVTRNNLVIITNTVRDRKTNKVMRVIRKAAHTTARELFVEGLLLADETDTQ